MRSLFLVARREFRAYWTSPVAYVVLAVFLVLAGIFYFSQLSQFVALSSRGGGQGVDVNQQLIRPYLYSVSVMILFILPLVSMRLISEEKRQGTLEILLTTPAPDWAVVVGKYLASVALLGVMVAGSMVHVSILYAFGHPEWGPVWTGFLGLFLTGAAYLALGLFLSALTQNQVVSAAAAFSLFLALWLMHSLGAAASGTLSRVLTYVSFAGHFDNFGRGVLDTSDVIFFLTLTGAGVFLAVQAVTATRWKP
jgi:ABC-2 type transport system permease protein